MDHHLLPQMRQIAEMLVSEVATSELLAAYVSLGRRRSCVDEDDRDKACAPHVNIVGRDLAHCAMRVLRKPWTTDSHITALAKTVWHSDSASADGQRPQGCVARGRMPSAARYAIGV